MRLDHSDASTCRRPFSLHWKIHVVRLHKNVVLSYTDIWWNCTIVIWKVYANCTVELTKWIQIFHICEYTDLNKCIAKGSNSLLHLNVVVILCNLMHMPYMHNMVERKCEQLQFLLDHVMLGRVIKQQLQTVFALSDSTLHHVLYISSDRCSLTAIFPLREDIQ